MAAHERRRRLLGMEHAGERLRIDGAADAAELARHQRSVAPAGPFFHVGKKTLVGRELIEQIGAGPGAAHLVLGELAGQLPIVVGRLAHALGGAAFLFEMGQPGQGLTAGSRLLAERLAAQLEQAELGFEECAAVVAFDDGLGEAEPGFAADLEGDVEHADEGADGIGILLRLDRLPLLDDRAIERGPLLGRRLGEHRGDPATQPDVDRNDVTGIVERGDAVGLVVDRQGAELAVHVERFNQASHGTPRP